MFFEEGNCTALRLLNEASYFLEASLEKLLELEQEAIAELNGSNKNQTECVSGLPDSDKSLKTNEETSNMKLKCVSIENVLDKINSENECTCTYNSTCDTCNNLSQKIRLSTPMPLMSLSFPTENPYKRKHETMNLNQDNTSNKLSFEKQIRTNDDGKKHQHLPEVYKENFVIKDEMINTTEPDIYIINDNTSEIAINCDNIVEQHCQKDVASELKKVTKLEEYFKVCIKFKLSLPYERVEELIKSIGLDDVFDIVLTKKKAEVTFLKESSMKKALNLTPDDLNKLKASSILPIKEQNK